MLYDLCEVLRVVSVALWPFLPSTSEEMVRQLGLEDKEKRTMELFSWGKTNPGTKINKDKPLFPRVEK